MIREIILSAIIIFAPQKTNQEKKYSLSATVSDYSLCLKLINDPDNGTANERKYITNLITTQINPQLQKDTSKNK